MDKFNVSPLGMEIVMSTVIASKFALNRGNARVWCEGRKLAREGIAVGMKYELKFDQANRQVNVLFGHDLVNVSGSVSRRKLRGTDNEYLPVIDMSDKKFLELFEESEEIRMYLFTRTGLTASVLPGWDNLSSRCTP